MNSAGKDYSKYKDKRDSYNSTDDEQTSVRSYGEQYPNINTTKNNPQNVQQSIYQYQQLLQKRLCELQVLQIRLQTQSLDLQVNDYVNTFTSPQWIEQFVQLGKQLQTQYLLQYQLIDSYINYIKQESLNALSEIQTQQKQLQTQINNFNQVYDQVPYLILSLLQIFLNHYLITLLYYYNILKHHYELLHKLYHLYLFSLKINLISQFLFLFFHITIIDITFLMMLVQLNFCNFFIEFLILKSEQLLRVHNFVYQNNHPIMPQI